MSSAVLFQEFEVVPRLVEMRLPREYLLNIFDLALGERANVNLLDPVETGGTEMRRWMTRYLREDDGLKELGWTLCRHGQIEGIKNDNLELKLAFTNTDARTGIISKQPSNIAEKGVRTAGLAEQNHKAAQFNWLGLDAVDQIDPIAKYDFWYFCGHVSDDYVSAEISRPDEMVGGFIRNFSERIIICQPGEKTGLRSHKSVPEDFAEVDQPAISRKR